MSFMLVCPLARVRFSVFVSHVVTIRFAYICMYVCAYTYTSFFAFVNFQKKLEAIDRVLAYLCCISINLRRHLSISEVIHI